MREFGSDFHYMGMRTCDEAKNTFPGKYPNAIYYANGRQALLSAIKLGKYKRVWIPAYFCYEVVGYLLDNSGVDIIFYDDFPIQNDESIIRNLNFKHGDTILRVNYFGWRTFRDNTSIPVPVIEDHSHDLIGNWASNSNADWCIASLRKTLPLPEGGVLWSPKGHETKQPLATKEIDVFVEERLGGMSLKSSYLEGKDIDKSIFREILISTEDKIGNLEMSGMSIKSMDMLHGFNIKEWYSYKKQNWEFIRNSQLFPIDISAVENHPKNTPFSIVLKFVSKEHRESSRKRLIDLSVYPAILWQVPDYNSGFKDAKSFSEQMLSIHCDGRYNLEDMKELSRLILKSL